MQNNSIRIGTRESQLAIWQAELVRKLLEESGHKAQLVYIKSEGDIDLITPLYAMGVQGVFTRSLDIALLNDKIDIAVHSMKDVPVQLPQGITQAAILKRASYKDLLVTNSMWLKGYATIEALLADHRLPLIIATSSIRRKAQWLHRYPNTTIENLRGNINTRLQKVKESSWTGAIFAAAGLERINLRSDNSIDLDWMLPAPAQGAIMVVAKENDTISLEACAALNDIDTATCVKAERDFLNRLKGGCSTPISALAEIAGNKIVFKGNIVSPDGKNKTAIEKIFDKATADAIGNIAAEYILNNGGKEIMLCMRDEN